MTVLLWIASIFAFFIGWAFMGVAADEKAKTGDGSAKVYDWVGLALLAFAVAGFSRLVAA